MSDVEDICCYRTMSFDQLQLKFSGHRDGLERPSWPRWRRSQELARVNRSCR